MVIDYRGKKIRIKDQYVDDYEKYYGFKLSSVAIDNYIFDELVKDKTKESNVAEIAAKLDNEQIERITEDYLLFVLRLYTRNPKYGAKSIFAGYQGCKGTV